MHKAITHALRFTAIMAAILVVAAITAPSSSPTSPYASVLSDLAGAPAMAAACNHKACDDATGKCVTPSLPTKYNCKGACVITFC